MTDWTSAVVVALTGIISVFLVLGLLNLAVTVTGIIFQRMEKTKLTKPTCRAKLK